MVRRLAFVVDQTQQLCGALLQAVWPTLGSKRLVWERLRALCYAYALEARRQWLAALFYGLEKPRPSFALTSSEARSHVLLCPCFIALIPYHRGKAMPQSRDESFATRSPVRAERSSHFQRQNRMVKMLRALSEAIVT
jgi:hypothetical protein